MGTSLFNVTLSQEDFNWVQDMLDAASESQERFDRFYRGNLRVIEDRGFPDLNEVRRFEKYQYLILMMKQMKQPKELDVAA
jgi:hypothetical protein